MNMITELVGERKLRQEQQQLNEMTAEHYTVEEVSFNEFVIELMKRANVEERQCYDATRISSM